MASRKNFKNNGTLYFSTRRGDLQECTIGSNRGCIVPMEAGEFFYAVDNVFTPVKCNACESFQLAYLEESSCMTADETLTDYEDHMDFKSVFECANCGRPISINLFATWYNNKVKFFNHRSENCRLIEFKNTDQLLSKMRERRELRSAIQI